ncbi:MAG TPA: hypothetical protein VIY90_05390 [Steroidobacteraceae bacterium]
MSARILPVLLLTLAVCPAHAQHNSAQRTRAFAALPDWTGFWETDTAAALASPGPRPPPPAGASVEELFKRVTPLFGDPPYNPEWVKKSRSDPERAGLATPSSSIRTCKDGFPAVADEPTPDWMFQAMVTPEETLFLFLDGEARHIYTDGRPHPKKEDLWPTAMGDSIGHWEGATLVIDTVAHKAGPVSPGFISPTPLPGLAILSEQARFTERVRMLDHDTMQDELTIDDPQRFAHPWKLVIRYKRVTNVDRMIPTDCTENDRNPLVNGKLTIAPP